MAMRATPIVVCGDGADRPEAALAAGAVDVVGPLDAPPAPPSSPSALRRHLKVASRVPVITHPRARLRARSRGRPPPVRPPDRDGPAGPGRPGRRRRAVAERARTARRRCRHRPHRRARRRAHRWWSPSAPRPAARPRWRRSCATCPGDLDAAVLVVQHMAEGFLDGLARWLDEASPLHVVVAADGDRVVPGTVYLAPAGTNMLVGAGLPDPLPSRRAGPVPRPGVDSDPPQRRPGLRARAVGVLLTGMGRDGAVGLRAMRDAGARTIGQDESSSVVYGMPAAAMAVGALDLGAAPGIGRGRADPSGGRAGGAAGGARGPGLTRSLSTADFDVVREYLRRTAGLEFDEGRRVGLAAVLHDRLTATGLAERAGVRRRAGAPRQPDLSRGIEKHPRRLLRIGGHRRGHLRGQDPVR